MGLEADFDNIDDLNIAFPVDTDPVEEGDDHLRGIKQALQGNVIGDDTFTALKVAGDTTLNLRRPSFDDPGIQLLGDTGKLFAQLLVAPVTSIVTLHARNLTDQDILGLAIDPEGQSILYQLGNPSVVAKPTGVEHWRSTGTGTVIELNDAAGLAEAQVASSTPFLSLDNNVNARLTTLRGSTAAPADTTLLDADPLGGLTLYFAELKTMSTTVDGVDVQGTLIELDNAAASAAIIRANNAEGGIALWTDGAVGNLYQTDADGLLEDIWINMVPNGAVSLNFNGLARLATKTDGANVTSEGATRMDVIAGAAGVDPVLGLRGLANGGMNFYFDESSTTGVLRHSNAAGANLDVAIAMNMDAAVDLYYNGVLSLKTAERLSNNVLSGAEVLDPGDSFRPVGFNLMISQTQAGNVTLDEERAGQRVHMTGGGQITIPTTLPPGFTCVATALSQDATVTFAGTIRWYDGAGTQTGNTFTLLDGGVMTIFVDSGTGASIWGSGIEA